MYAMDQPVEDLTTPQEAKPTSEEDAGVWKTTQLDSAIGDLQRGGTVHAKQR